MKITSVDLKISAVRISQYPDDNKPEFNNIYLKTVTGEETYNEPSKYLKSYLEGQGVDISCLFGANTQANNTRNIENLNVSSNVNLSSA